jgi:hypothetical protein
MWNFMHLQSNYHIFLAAQFELSSCWIGSLLVRIRVPCGCLLDLRFFARRSRQIGS